MKRKRYPRKNTLLAQDWVRHAKDVLTDQGWEGPPIVYLLCRPYIMGGPAPEKLEPEFIARVKVDPDWAIPRWRMGTCIQFTENVGKHLFYVVEEMPDAEAETLGVAFESIPLYDVDGKKLMSFD